MTRLTKSHIVKKASAKTVRYYYMNNAWGSVPKEVSLKQLNTILTGLVPNPKFVIDVLRQEGKVQLPAFCIEIKPRKKI